MAVSTFLNGLLVPFYSLFNDVNPTTNFAILALLSVTALGCLKIIINLIKG